MTNSGVKWAEGRVALVTGATSGFGWAMARRITHAGGKVIATGRRVERLEALATDCPESSIITRAMDVRVPGSITRALADLPSDFAAIDVLFNNAGMAAGMDKAQTARLEDWDTMIATNVSGFLHVTHSVLPGMVARNRGHILNLSSVAATYPYPGGNIYGATKAFVRQFSLNLRADLLGTAIRVTSIEPGMCETEFSGIRFRGDQKAADAVYADMHPLSADDVIDGVEAVMRLPAHMNINTIEMMPVQQAFSPFAVDRSGALP